MTDPKSGVSRRTFLAGTSLAAGSAAFGKLAPQRPWTGAAASGLGSGRYAHGLHEITLTLGFATRKLKVEPRTTLLDALHDILDLTGTKKVCDRGSCGACTVLLDNKPVNACMMLAIDAVGRTIDPIESFSSGDKIHPLQQAFVDCDALQCGYCTPGMIVSARACLDRYEQPSRDQIRHAMSGNICRCGTYTRVFEAIEKVAKMKQGKPK